MSNKNNLRSFSSALQEVENWGARFDVRIKGDVFDQIIERSPNLTAEELLLYAAAHLIRQPKDLEKHIRINFFE